MLFGYRGRNGRLAMLDGRDGTRFRLSGDRAAKIITAFVEPRSIESAGEDGFTIEELDEAREAGLLVSDREPGDPALWERNGWSRPAYLVFSQMNIPYRETVSGTGDRAALRQLRGAAIAEYQSAEPYPEPAPLVHGTAVELPDPPATAPTLSGLVSRRSARGFSRRPPTGEQLAGVLHRATQSFRELAEDRADGDPFRLLNSFYSWAHLFVVVQSVEGVPRGIYEYDWAGHRLLTTPGQLDDDALLASVQGQKGILGTGFAVFVVADLRGYAWIYRHSRAYVHVLIQVGELGQELLMAATDLDLAGWTTPAVHESRSAALLELPEDDSLEVLSMVKLGRPVR